MSQILTKTIFCCILFGKVYFKHTNVLSLLKDLGMMCLHSPTRILRHRCQREQEGRRSERTEVRQARLDRQPVHGEESVAFSGFISVELDSEGPSCQLAVNIKNFEAICYITRPLISDIVFLYQLAQAHSYIF